MSLHICSSNKLEKLAARFARDIYSRPGGDPMTPRLIVIQTRGMADWLKFRLAEETPIAANLEMPYLNNFINRMMERVFPSELRAGFRRDAELFSAPVMAWRIHRLLAEQPERWPEPTAYCSGAGIAESELKRWQLAVRIAGLFDQYQIYRYDELARWPDAPPLPRCDWQRGIYLELLREGHGREYYFSRFFELKTVPAEALPEEIAVFGIGAMPPVYLEFIRKLSEFCRVDLFYQNPCREFWEHQYSRREVRNMIARDGGVPEEFGGNPLLANWGMQGRQFFKAVMELPSDELFLPEEELEDFIQPPPPDADYRDSSMLTALQQDIFTMRDRSDGPGADGDLIGGKLQFPPEDRSIRIHNCHSRRREVEVLHDQLLHLLATGGTQPRDILVMAPDIGVYAPYIASIFGQGPLAGLYAISDRSIRTESRIAEAFLQLLKLPGGRFEVSQVLEFMETPAVRNRFSIAEEEFGKIENWLRQGAIHWGFDAETRRRYCEVPFEQFSWSQGLDRLLLGFAMVNSDTTEPFDDMMLPAGFIEGGDALLLGNLISLVRRIAELKAPLAACRPAAEWVTLLDGMLDAFFAADKENLEELAALRGAVAAIGRGAELAGSAVPLPVAVITDILSGALETPAGGQNFLRGGITFASLVPMRSIPMKTVAILGLNEGEFPRQDLKLGFNLIADKVRPCDRSRQAEDRYLFLEAVLAAREQLLLFYDGQDERTNESRPAAAPLAELAGYLDKLCGYRETRHKLQPFEATYFAGLGNADFISYSAEDAAAATAIYEYLHRTEDPTRHSPLPALPETELPRLVPLDELERFFDSPARWFLKNRVGMNLYEAPPVPSDDEPLMLDNLELYKLKSELAAGIVAGKPRQEQLRALKRNSRLPLGAPGDQLFDTLYEQIAQLPEEWKTRIRNPARLPVDVEIGPCKITGMAETAPDGSAVYLYSFTKNKHKYHISLLLRQLAIAAQTSGNQPVTATALFLENGCFITGELPAVTPEEARPRLGALLEEFRRGQSRPLPIFEKATPHFAGKRGDFSERIAAARDKFAKGTEQYPCDGMERAVALCFDEELFDDPEFQQEFARLAELIYPPVHATEEVTQ